MKKLCSELIDRQADDMIQLGRRLFETPELGFKEWKTKKLLIEALAREGLSVEKEYCMTGFQVSVGSGHPHIGLIAELDAIPTLGHPCADPSDQNAAHSCGHSTQCAIMANALTALKQSGLTDKGGRITLFFTPAEEFTDLDYRRRLVAEGKIRYLAGKVNMLTEGLFDDVDVCLHLHAMGSSRYHFAVNSSLAGFIYKKFIFQGRASHAAVLPQLGVNALNAFALFQCAAGMLRETFEEADINRFHGIVTEGGQTVNSIPERVVYESYVRSFNSAKLKSLSDQLSETARHCAAALGGQCEVEDMPGYLPFVPDARLSDVVYQNMLQLVPEDQILRDEKSVAAGDIGDLGCFVPTIQFGYTGFEGTIHGRDMAILDENQVYIEPAKIIAMTCVDLIQKPELIAEIQRQFQPAMSRERYLEYLAGK